MSKKLKYVRHRYGFVVFDGIIQHKDIRINDIVSAGFCFLFTEDGKIMAECYGHSVSLNLKSKDEDSGMLTKFLNEPEI